MTTIEAPAPLTVTEKREALLYNMLSHTTHFLKRFLKHQKRRNTLQSLEAAEYIKQELQLAQEWLHEFKGDAINQDAFAALADELDAQIAQEIADVWDVLEYVGEGGRVKIWCDSVGMIVQASPLDGHVVTGTLPAAAAHIRKQGEP